jgi:hypothetical protein
LGNPSLLGQGSIYFAINAPVGSTLNTNSYILIDDLYLGVDNTGIIEQTPSYDIIEKVYPNPAEDIAYLVFNQKKFGQVSLKVFDVMGNLVKEVMNESLMEGKYKAEIDVSALQQGLYFCKLISDGVVDESKLIKN